MKHLFVLSPNNCGSTLLHNLLATSPNVAHLNYQEGQNVSWIGPHPINFGTTRVFTESENQLSDGAQYNWNIIAKNWNEIWFRNNPDATIRLEKTPANICRAHLLEQNFEDAYFVIMPRNPYAQIESIKKYLDYASLERIARHSLRCLQICTKLSTELSNSIYFTYELLSNYPQDVADNLIEFLPELKHLNVNKKFIIHNDPPSVIKNLNHKHINNLNGNQIKKINSILNEDRSVMEYWGYEYEF